ncbi:MAG: Alpha/Beta hydrolase protein [Monoraphidium minutum]|nr:MAG: Alpha/Beta hydrolase protein [Monoraphidium minutum]
MASRSAVLVSALLLVAAIGAASADDYTADGPCGGQKAKHAIILPKETGCKMLECLMNVIVTRPDPAKAGVGACAKGPYPVVYLFNGFSSRAEWYSYLPNRLASYGYVVVQYNLNAILTTDAQEMKYLKPLQVWLQGESADASSPLSGALDFSQQATAGHSRGGKLAALHMAAEPKVFTTAVLIDPVDNTIFSPEGPAYPNAAKALAALDPKKTAAVIGASVTSLCNPADANFETFYAPLGPGSWREVQAGATHTSYVALLEGVVPLPPVCGKGDMPAADVQKFTMATTVAWFEQAFRGASTADFEAWIKAQKGITFGVKA